MGKTYRHRGRLRSIILIATICLGGVVGLGAGTARTGATTIATAHYPAGTVVRLHQRLVRVNIQNFAFSPARLVVSPGTKIVWTNRDGDPHTIASTKGVWTTSDALDTGDHYGRVFKKAGTFAYYCSIHPFMHGTVIVKK